MAAAPSLMVQIIHMQGGLKGQIQEFVSDLITIGRVSVSSVRFPADEPGVSREHASIRREGNQFKLTDLSKFGTFVNGKQVREIFLKNGDVIEFGPGGPKASFSVEVTSAAPSPSPPPFIAAPPPVTPPPLQRYEAPPPPTEAQSGNWGVVAPPERYVPPQRSVAADAGGFVPPVQKNAAPLVIQFGPTIRSYRELPVVIGTDTRCDFVLKHPGILGQHAQLFFYGNNYWIKDLTGQQLVKVNMNRISGQTQLNPHDLIECGPQGPLFKFLGDGRLAEVEPESDAPSVAPPSPPHSGYDEPPKNNGANLLSKFIKGFRT